MKHLKETLIKEGMSKEKLYDIVDKMKEAMSADELLDELCQALSDKELEENLRWIDRTHDLNLF